MGLVLKAVAVGVVWWHGSIAGVPLRSGKGPLHPVLGPRIDDGIATSMVPGQLTTMPAAMDLQNDGNAPATILAVTPVQGRSPAPAIITYVVVHVPADDGVPINVRPPGAAGIGARVLPGEKHAVVFDVTSGPTKAAITWMQGIDVRYRCRGRDYTTYVPAITTYCGADLKLYCPADGWKLGFTRPTSSSSTHPPYATTGS